MPFYAFQLVTQQTGATIALDGALLGWEDEEIQRVNEHLILNRPGAIHQNQGPGPRQFTFRCLLRSEPGKPVSDRRKAISETLSADPFCLLTHPRLGGRSVVYLGLHIVEDMEVSTNSITIEIHLAETGLRDEAKEGAATAARQATAASSLARTLTARSAALAQLGVVLDTEALAFVAALDSAVSQYELQVALGRVQGAADALVLASGVGVLAYPVTSAARLAYGQALAAYELAGAQLPPIVPYIVPQRMSLARLCQSLYGGGAAAMEAEILRLNRIPNPFSIPAGTVLLLPDPKAVKL